MDASAKKCIKRIRNRLDRWELPHLRELAAKLHSELEQALDRAESAERAADMWHDHCAALQAQLHLEQPDVTIGITQEGTLHILKSGAA